MASGTVAVMQPYLFPYIGYFHLITAADQFVFYDDVSFIKQGWINRNNILLGGRPFPFTVPVSDISSFRLIRDVRLAGVDRWFTKFDKTLAQAYAKAPCYGEVIRMIRSVFTYPHASIADLAIASIEQTFDYLGIAFRNLRSSISFPHTQGMPRAERLMAITKDLGYSDYVNAPGGKSLYNQAQFSKGGIRLSFIKSDAISYKQNTTDFVPSLSIMDTLMFNDKATVRGFLTRFKLE